MKNKPAKRVTRYGIMRCPFCNCLDASIANGVAGIYFVHCRICNATGPTSTKADVAAALWNGTVLHQATLVANRNADQKMQKKVQLDAKSSNVRVLAMELFVAGQKQKRTQKPEIWGSGASTTWRDLPSESVEVWDAIALCAMGIFNRSR